MSQPNLLLVFADQMRGMDMGCAGNRQIDTPHLDALAASGVRCSRHYATVPVCGPNRAVLLTGTYPTRNKVVGNDLPLPIEIPSLGTILNAQGYNTGYIGKWHLDGLPRDRFTPPGARRHGFDFWSAYNCAHDYFHPRYFRYTPELIEASGYEPVVQTDLAIEFIQSQKSKTPWSLVVSWGPPHNPYDQVPEQFRALYDPREIALRPNVVEPIDNVLARGLDCRRTHADYYAAISALDFELGRLLKALQESGQDESTLVVFTSDHGDMLWSHGLMQKQLPYEEAIHVPLLLRWPGRLPAGREMSTPCATVDIVPTLLSLMQVPIPTGVQGRDISTLLKCKDTDDEEAGVLLANYLVSDQATLQNVPEWRGVRTRRHTYVEEYSSGERRPWLFFDNEVDVFQQKNLIDSPQHGALRVELKTRLDACLEKTGDEFSGAPNLLSRLGLQEMWDERERMMKA